MQAETLDTFESSLDELGVGRTRTTTETFREAVLDTVIEPAVGAPLPIDGVSLDETSIEMHPTPTALEAAKTGVTVAELGIASYGSVVIRDTRDGTEPVSLFCDLHVAVLRERDIVADMPAAFEWLGTELRTGSSAILATGPSATADMGSLVYGAHGPTDVHVLILTDQ